MRQARNFDLLHTQVLLISTPSNTIESYVPISESGLQCDYDNVRFGSGRLTAREERHHHALYKLPKYRSSRAADRLLVHSAADLRKRGSL
jgi:hypothetical protein